MTIGELARLFNSEDRIGADADVVTMENWRRERVVRRNEPGVGEPVAEHAEPGGGHVVPGIGMLEYGNLSVGRGTDTPFEQIGAPWIDGRALASVLNARSIPGVRVYPVRFTPASSKYAGEVCQGVFFVVTDREAMRPVRLGLEVAAALVRLYGDRYDLGKTAVVAGIERAGRCAACGW